MSTQDKESVLSLALYADEKEHEELDGRTTYKMWSLLLGKREKQELLFLHMFRWKF